MTSLGDERKPASGTDFRSGWQPVGESFLMNESIAVREWRNQGHLARQRDVLLRVLRTKLSGEDLAMVRIAPLITSRFQALKGTAR